MSQEIIGFKNQIQEDIELIKENYNYRSRYDNDDYIFNHWILDKIYGLDEDLLPECILDQCGDKQIDCFVHHTDTKRLYIIQNKHYNISRVDEKYITAFLAQPLQHLKNGDYPCNELQKAYNLAMDDEDYEIFLHLYSLEDKFTSILYDHVKAFNNKEMPKIRADIYSIGDIYDLYYGDESHENQIPFSYQFNYDENQALLLKEGNSLLNKRFKNAKYIATPIVEIYKMYDKAKKEKYNIFDDNIREYLGKSKINKQIIKTLSDDNERNNFFYYNNGITLTCRDQKTKLANEEGEIRRTATTIRTVILSKPQIINGCQTVNAIYDVLDSDPDTDKRKYKDVYVLVKILDFKSGNDNEDRFLYNKIVECTNNQNAIKISDFAVNNSYFERMHKEFLERGIFIEIKRSDKNKFKETPRDSVDKLFDIAKKRYSKFVINKQNIEFSLEKMILVYMAIFKNGYFAYTKKSMILNPSSEIYKTISKKLDKLTYDNLIKMYLLFIKINNDKKQSVDKRTPIPYYIFSLIGHLLNREKEGFQDRVNNFFEEIFRLEEKEFNMLYSYLCYIVKHYTKTFKEKNIDYNTMIKMEIDLRVLEESINMVNDFREEESRVSKVFFEKINSEEILPYVK